jgi:hypothetical protein
MFVLFHSAREEQANETNGISRSCAGCAETSLALPPPPPFPARCLYLLLYPYSSGDTCSPHLRRHRLSIAAHMPSNLREIGVLYLSGVPEVHRYISAPKDISTNPRLPTRISAIIPRFRDGGGKSRLTVSWCFVVVVLFHDSPGVVGGCFKARTKRSSRPFRVSRSRSLAHYSRARLSSNISE